ncbi:hypothetical protein BkAM31D_20770 [Halalkalibacter krulwichiae]|uniref:Uncharacterized protein n=1 Tax=Halalkalibacter krulwichiae TaxID=199441 RepID=A0A1X9MF84_9BACI|nr:hypothetical protein BkAM31D_20770 [Halalkalibacter krulwichiae]
MDKKKEESVQERAAKGQDEQEKGGKCPRYPAKRH